METASPGALSPRPLRASVAATWLLTALALGAGTYRVWRLESSELEHETTPRTLETMRHEPAATRVSARIDSVVLRAGDHATFELCARDGLPAARWQHALELAVVQVAPPQLLLRVPFDSAHLARVRRNPLGGCLLLGSGTIEHSGTYTVEAVWPTRPPPAEVLAVPMRLRVTAKAVLAQGDRLCVVGLGACVLCLLAAMLAAPRTQASLAPSSGAPRTLARTLPAVAAVFALFAASQLRLFGATFTLLKGVLLFTLQVGLAFGLGRLLQPHDGVGRPGVRAALGLQRPPHPLTALPAALIAWPLLVLSARLSLRLVPSTGEAPIEAFIAWPSGMLAAALLGVVLPLGEELFFRGYVYGALVIHGRALAAATCLLVFTLLHVQQTWGNWGSLLAVVAAGAVLTGLRVVTGSALVSAFTHVAYNLTLSLGSMYAASGP